MKLTIKNQTINLSSSNTETAYQFSSIKDTTVVKEIAINEEEFIDYFYSIRILEEFEDITNLVKDNKLYSFVDNYKLTTKEVESLNNSDKVYSTDKTYILMYEIDVDEELQELIDNSKVSALYFR